MNKKKKLKQWKKSAKYWKTLNSAKELRIDRYNIEVNELQARINAQATELNEAQKVRGQAHYWNIFREKLVEAKTITAHGAQAVFTILLHPPGAENGEVIVGVENLQDHENSVKTNKPMMLIDAINMLDLRHSRISGK